MFCTKCGSQIADGSKFCYVCGAKHESEAENAPAQFATAADNSFSQPQVDSYDATVSITDFSQNNAPVNDFNDGGFANNFGQNQNAGFEQMPVAGGVYGQSQADNFDSTVSMTDFGQAPVQDFNAGFNPNAQFGNADFNTVPINPSSADLSYDSVAASYDNQNNSGSTISLMEYNNDSNINNLFEAALADDGEQTQRLDVTNNNSAWPSMDDEAMNGGVGAFAGQSYPEQNTYNNTVDSGNMDNSYNSAVATPAPAPAKKKKGLPAGAIIGIIAGGLLVLGGLAVGGYFVATNLIGNDGGGSTSIVVENDDKNNENQNTTGNDADNSGENNEVTEPDPFEREKAKIAESGIEYAGMIAESSEIECYNGEIVNNGDGSFYLNATGSDPQIVNLQNVVDITPYMGKTMLVSMTFESDVYTTMQLFYLPEGDEGYSEEKSSFTPIGADGTVYFYIPITENVKLRLDTPDNSRVRILSFKVTSND